MSLARTMALSMMLLAPGSLGLRLFTAKESEKMYGSPHHCRLEQALSNRGKKTVTLAVVGGSATAGASHGEPVGVNNTWFNNLNFQSRLGKEVTLHNAAQGSTNSFWSASTLDTQVGDADILFWEYAMNDRNGCLTGHATLTGDAEMAKMVEFWLQKATALPSKPALVFVYMYDTCSVPSGQFASSAFKAQKEVIQRYIDQGHDILVIPASPVMLAIGKSEAMADYHHPNNKAHNAISDLVASALVNSARDVCGPEDDDFFQQAKGARRSAADNFQQFPTLAKMLSMRSASDTLWEPQFRSLTSNPFVVEKCSSDGSCGEDGARLAGASQPLRMDRKVSWKLPLCKNGDAFLKSGKLFASDGQPFVMNDKLTVDVQDPSICADAKYMTLDIAKTGEHKTNPFMGKVAFEFISTEGRQEHLLFDMPSLAQDNKFTPDSEITMTGNMPEALGIDLSMKISSNVWVDLSKSTGSEASGFARKFGDAVTVPSGRCRLLSVCAVSAGDKDALFKGVTVWY